MSVVIPIIVRLLGLFGVSMSPFMVGAALSVLALLGSGVALLAASHHGYAKAAGVCQEKALKAQLQIVTIERNSLNDRATRAEDRAREAADVVRTQGDDINQLRGEVKLLQSTKEGAKRDAKALMDDRCNVTGAGRQRLR
jgi:hypothetical protein